MKLIVTMLALFFAGFAAASEIDRDAAKANAEAAIARAEAFQAYVLEQQATDRRLQQPAVEQILADNAQAIRMAKASFHRYDRSDARAARFERVQKNAERVESILARVMGLIAPPRRPSPRRPQEAVA